MSLGNTKTSFRNGVGSLLTGSSSKIKANSFKKPELSESKVRLFPNGKKEQKIKYKTLKTRK